MAHNADKIPWNLLTSNLQAEFHGTESKSASDLHWQKSPESTEKLTDFVNSFLHHLEAQIQAERQKYPDEYEEFGEDERLLNDEQIRAITPAVQRMLQNTPFDIEWQVKDSCQAHSQLPTANLSCDCNIPFDKLTMNSFFCPYQQHGCSDFLDINGNAFFCLEMIKVLLMSNEMNTILNMCATPSVEYSLWRTVASCSCVSADLGWDVLFQKALSSYIWLNVLYCLPEIWESKSGQCPPRDYRNLAIYQRLVRECTMSTIMTDTASYSHRDFFGIVHDQFCAGFEQDSERIEDEAGVPYGKISFEELLNLEGQKGPFQVPPHTDTLSYIRRTLQNKGLPPELTQTILEFAGYAGDGQSQLKVPHHPFHSENRTRLVQYLDECWQLVIRCGMFWEANRQRPWWEHELNPEHARELVPNWKQELASIVVGDLPGTSSWYRQFLGC